MTDIRVRAERLKARLAGYGTGSVEAGDKGQRLVIYRSLTKKTELKHVNNTNVTSETKNLGRIGPK